MKENAVDRMWVWGLTLFPRDGAPRVLPEHWISIEDDFVRVWRSIGAATPVAEAPLSYVTIHWNRPPEEADQDG